MADEEPSHQSPLRPSTRSGWIVNWTGVLAIAIVGLVAFAGWRWLEGGDDDVAGAVPTRITTGSTVASTTVARSSTTVARQNPPTTVAATTTTVVPGRRVIISGEMKPCRFGDNCLVASFRIEGFDPHPGRFVCIYPNSRSDFGFRNDGVDEACLTADQGDTITIEVDGVRSATISEQNLDGSADG